MPNISRSKRNQTLKFGQVKDHNKRNNFLQRNNYSTSSKIYITSVYAVQGQLELFQMLNTFLVILKCTRLCTDKVYGLLSVLSAYCKNLKSKFWSCFSVVFFVHLVFLTVKSLFLLKISYIGNIYKQNANHCVFWNYFISLKTISRVSKKALQCVMSINKI